MQTNSIVKLKEQTLKLILYQGNRFIKELLRTKNLPIGSTKSQFEKHLVDAIDSGKLTAEHIEAWLQAVEGWGDQHAYMYVAPEGMGKDTEWKDSTIVRQAVKRAGYEKLWNAPTSFEFPEAMKLTSILHSGTALTFIWQQGLPAYVRREELDHEGNIGGEEIVWDAYARRWGRALMRFEWRFDLGLAGIFLGRAKDQTQYAARRDEVVHAVRPLVDIGTWTPLDIHKAVNALDELDLKSGENGEGGTRVRATSTLFVATGGSVRMASTLKDKSYQDDLLVREVRRAVDTRKFVGGAGDFYVNPVNLQNARELHLRLYGREHRILFWGSMKAEEVWQTIADIHNL